MPSTEFEVENCPGCGNIYRKTTWSMCQDCKLEMEHELSKCSEFLRRNRQTTLREVSEKTGVTEGKIVKYIKDSKLFIIDTPNVFYPCDLCNGDIRKGNLCIACRSKINTDIDKMNIQEIQDKEKLRKDNQVSYKISDRLKKN
jgi:hypothetical protein